MQATAQSIYAIYALVYIGCKNAPVKASEISEKSSIPKRFLEITLTKLKKGNILNSKKGANGGFYLKKSPKDISILDIISITENNLTLFDCEKHIPLSCRFKSIFESINQQYLFLLKSITLYDIIKAQSQDFLDFVI